jgi:hypothetical protein
LRETADNFLQDPFSPDVGNQERLASNELRIFKKFLDRFLKRQIVECQNQLFGFVCFVSSVEQIGATKAGR